ncbi:UNVERIFIED_CONTAM: Tryptase beta-2 [Trichonephila clavipes]
MHPLPNMRSNSEVDKILEDLINRITYVQECFSYDLLDGMVCSLQNSLMHARCKTGEAPLECYFEANLFSIQLLGKRKLETILKIKRIIPHPKFDFTKILNDIALLELEEPLKCTGKTSPICLPTKEEMYKTGKTLFVAGWGKNEPDKILGPQVLREGAMKEIEGKHCMTPELPKETIEQYQCSAGTSQTSCHGDSGTSNFIRYQGKFYALGVTSHGASEWCSPTFPNTFTKVLYFLNWIKEHVKDLPEP